MMLGLQSVMNESNKSHNNREAKNNRTTNKTKTSTAVIGRI